jgi:hypothetical protein
VWKRIILVVLLAGGIGTGWATGLFDDITLFGVRRLIEEAGWWGPVLLVALFGLEGFGVVPAFPFLLTAAAIWPPVEALLINLTGALLASLVGFTYARTLGREFSALQTLQALGSGRACHALDTLRPSSAGHPRYALNALRTLRTRYSAGPSSIGELASLVKSGSESGRRSCLV